MDRFGTLLIAWSLVPPFSINYDFPYVAASYIPSENEIQAHITTASPTLLRETESTTIISGYYQHSTSAITEHEEIVPVKVATSGIFSTYPESIDITVDGPNVQEFSHNSKRSNENQVGEQNYLLDTRVGHHMNHENAINIPECSHQNRDYNISLRVGLLFVILVTSFVGVAGPIFLKPVLSTKFQVIFLLLKQLGTGVIVATAFVHLLTHAQLMFTNKCLGELEYEATPTAIVMAGLFFAFVVENMSHRLARRFWAKTQYNGELISVVILEAGIIFHSLLVGLTLAVADDSFYITLFVVILFHQLFEGLALGTRIASIDHLVRVEGVNSSSRDESESVQEPATTDNKNSLNKKLLMAAAFALTTPVGQAIGIGVLKQFNGNDPSTLVALGTLDALSAGILIWVGVVEMWARDWMFGELAEAGPIVTILSGFGLVLGMAIMSLLGRWT